MEKQKVGPITILILLVVISIAVFYVVPLRQQLSRTKTELQRYKTNERVLQFSELFIEKVLEAQGEVDFETRLTLEQKVRDLKDKDILDQWNKLIASKTEGEAQKETVNLLKLLTSKIQSR